MMVHVPLVWTTSHRDNDIWSLFTQWWTLGVCVGKNQIRYVSQYGGNDTIYCDICIAIFQCIDHFLQPETGSNKTLFLMIYFHVSVWWWRTSVGEHVTFVVSLITNPPVQTFVSDPCGAASPRPAVCHRVFLSLSFSFFLLTKFVCLLFVSPCSSAGHIQAWWELVGVQGCRPGKLCSR